MLPELNPRTWRSIFQDLSLDAVRTYLPAMGLSCPEDFAFAEGLRPLIEQYERQFTSDRGAEQFVNAVFQSARRYGQEYPGRIRDWGTFIYPNNTPLQEQIFRWQLIVARGGKDGARDVQPAPEVIRRLREILDACPAVSARQLHPVTEWDRRYCKEREDEGISPFEWVEAAARNYCFLSAWEAATKGSRDPEQMEQLYQWGLREAELLKMPKETIGRPEQYLRLPESLQHC